MKRICLTTLIYLTLISNGALVAQNRDSITYPGTVKEREMQILNQNWNVTGNAAGMGFSHVNTGSFTTLGLITGSGDYHKTQEGSARNALQFRTERYDKFNQKLYVKGSFIFTRERELDRAWSDVFHTYNSNPYIYGSSVKGNYETQRFDLNVKVYTSNFGKFNIGVEFDYKVADMARQRDPRSRSYLLDYSLLPSLTYSFSKTHTIGINVKYRFEKEKMPSLSTVQTNPNLKYYDFIGLEHVDGKIGGYLGFQRQFVSGYMGGAIQYNYISKKINWLTSIGFDSQRQETLGNKKQSPGSYNSYNYSLLTNLILRSGKYTHDLKIRGSILDGGADEFRQSLISSRDPQTNEVTETWETTYKYINRFIVKTKDLSADYKLYSSNNDNIGYLWNIGFVASYNEFNNYYYLPYSQYSVSKVFAGLNGSYSLLDKKHHCIDFVFRAVAGVPSNNVLILATQTEVSTQVLQPDLEFHNKKTLDGSLEVKYTFPLSFGRSKMQGYARFFAGNIFASDSMNWSNAGFSIGILTL